MTTASVVADDPSTAASTMASGRNGMTRNQSSMAMSNRSTRPPTKPAVTPTAEPMTTATTVATTPMKRLMRAPQMSWARTLRPSSSVPSGNSALGGARSGLPRPAAAVSSRAGDQEGRSERDDHEQHEDGQAGHAGSIGEELPAEAGGGASPPGPGQLPDRRARGPRRAAGRGRRHRAARRMRGSR